MPAHPDRATAVRVLEHPEHALDAGADAVSDGLRGDDVDELRARVVEVVEVVDADGIKVLRCLSVDPWTYVLYYRPELANRCTTLENINGMSRCTVLMRHPQFAEVWSMEELASRSGACWANQRGMDFRICWERLVSAQPQFAKWREGAAK